MISPSSATPARGNSVTEPRQNHKKVCCDARTGGLNAIYRIDLRALPLVPKRLDLKKA